MRTPPGRFRFVTTRHPFLPYRDLAMAREPKTRPRCSRADGATSAKAGRSPDPGNPVVLHGLRCLVTRRERERRIALINAEHDGRGSLDRRSERLPNLWHPCAAHPALGRLVRVRSGVRRLLCAVRPVGWVLPRRHQYETEQEWLGREGPLGPPSRDDRSRHALRTGTGNGLAHHVRPLQRAALLRDATGPEQSRNAEP